MRFHVFQAVTYSKPARLSMFYVKVLISKDLSVRRSTSCDEIPLSPWFETRSRLPANAITKLRALSCTGSSSFLMPVCSSVAKLAEIFSWETKLLGSNFILNGWLLQKRLLFHCAYHRYLDKASFCVDISTHIKRAESAFLTGMYMTNIHIDEAYYSFPFLATPGISTIEWWKFRVLIAHVCASLHHRKTIRSTLFKEKQFYKDYVVQSYVKDRLWIWNAI